MQIDGFDFVEKNGGTYLRDPENGALYPAMSGAQDDEWGGFSDFGSSDASSYDLGQNFTAPAILPDTFYGPPTTGQYYGPAATGSLATDVLQAGGQLNPNGTPQGGGSLWDQLTGGNVGGAAMPGTGAGGGGYGGSAGFGGLGLPGILGLLGGGAGLIGALTAGGVGQRTTPQLSVPARAAGNQAYAAAQGLAPFAAGTTPLQATQASILQGLASGQIPPGLAQLVQQAYGPQFQSLYGQAADAGRQAGFYDAPATAPPGGAILGPGLAQLQGQMANSLLGLATQLPGEFQAPINAQLSAAGNQVQGFNNLLNAYPTGSQTSQPLGNQVFQGLAGTLGGLGQGMAQNQNQQAQNQWQQSMLQAQNQQNANMQQLLGLQRIGAVPGGGGQGISFSGVSQGSGGYNFDPTYGPQ